MVANATMKDFCSTLSFDFLKEFIAFPETTVFRHNGTYATVSVPMSGGRSTSITLSVGYHHDIWSRPNQTPKIYFQLMGEWRNYPPGVTGNAVFLDFAEFRTCKEAFADLLKKFTDIFQKPNSNGCVKVFYDTSEFMWCWKRPNSSSIVERDGKYYYRSTVDGLISVRLNEDTVEDRFFNREELGLIAQGLHDTITQRAGEFWLKSALIPVYVNSLPFTAIERYITPSETDRYEFVMVNGERRYVYLRRAENMLNSHNIHGYSTRIEQLIPADKLFKKGKTDLYARRPTEETPYLGWELEACCNNSTVGKDKTAKVFKEHMPWQIMCKSDSSISPEGFETVSIPATLDFWKESNLSSALDSMRVSPYNMRSFNHSSCGFHVHVSRSALSVLDLQKLERFLHNPENNNFVTTVAGRQSSTYAKYNDKMFSDRKSLTGSTLRSEEYNVEGIDYFNGFESAQDYVNRMGRVDNELVNLKRFANFIANYVAHDSLTRLLVGGGETVSLGQEYGQYLGQHATFDNIISWSSVISCIRYGFGDNNPYYTGATQEIIGELYKKILMAISKQSPAFAGLVKTYFPDWDWSGVNFGTSPQNTDNSWKAGLLKSKAPVGRKNNQAACQVVKGPVGKAVNDRYDILNTRNTNTVEFRLFKGTMNPSSIMRYLEFVDAMVRFVAATSASNDGLGYQKFIKWLMGDSFNTIRYEHLISFIIDKGFLDRKEVRRKELVKVVSDDKVDDPTKLKVVEPIGFQDAERKPLGAFTTFAETPAPVMAPTGYDPDMEPDPDYDEDGDEYDPDPIGEGGCNCDSCVDLRGYEM